MVKKKKVRKSSKKFAFKKSKFKLKSPKDKVQLVLNNLLFFAAFSLVSLIFYKLVQDTILQNLFFMFSVAFGFTAVAFLIALLVLVIQKTMKR